MCTRKHTLFPGNMSPGYESSCFSVFKLSPVSPDLGRRVMRLKFKRSNLPQKWVSATASAVIHHKAQMQEAQTSIPTISFGEESDLIQSRSEKRRKYLDISKCETSECSF